MKNHYNPATRKIYLEAGASLYSRFHELAHKEQHECNSTVYLAWVILRQIRLVNYFATLWIEWDARRRTRAVMIKLGIWSDEAEREAKAKLLTYLKREEGS